MIMRRLNRILGTAVLGALLASQAFAATEARDILWQGLMGAGVGAISAEASGGKAGKGALIGAGTNVIGGALLNVLTGSGSSGGSYAQPVYAQPPHSYYSAPQVRTVSYAEPVYVQPASVDANRQIIRQGLLGAGTGALSAGLSGGKAGTGALIGAGTNVIGGALLDTLLAPSPASAPVYYSQPVYRTASTSAPVKRIVRKYDAQGNLVSEEEFLG